MERPEREADEERDVELHLPPWALPQSPSLRSSLLLQPSSAEPQSLQVFRPPRTALFAAAPPPSDARSLSQAEADLFPRT